MSSEKKFLQSDLSTKLYTSINILKIDNTNQKEINEMSIELTQKISMQMNYDIIINIDKIDLHTKDFYLIRNMQNQNNFLNIFIMDCKYLNENKFKMQTLVNYILKIAKISNKKIRFIFKNYSKKDLNYIDNKIKNSLMELTDYILVKDKAKLNLIKIIENIIREI